MPKSVQLKNVLTKTRLKTCLSSTERKLKQKKHDNLLEHEISEQLKTFQQIIALFTMFGKPFGITVTYDWKPGKRLSFWASIGVLIFTWFSMFYTQYTHLVNGELMKAIEVFACYGVAISVV